MKLDEWRARGPLRKGLGYIVGRIRPKRVKEAGTFERQPQNSLTPTSDQNSVQLGDLMTLNENPSSGAIEPADTRNQVEAASPNDVPGARGNPTMAQVDGRAEQGPRNPEQQQTIDSSTGDIITRTYAVDNSSCGHINVPKCMRSRNKTLEIVRKHTERYLQQEDVKQWIQECAETYVKARRARVKQDRSRWERACFGAWYQCLIPKCPRGEKKIFSVKIFRDTSCINTTTYSTKSCEPIYLMLNLRSASSRSTDVWGDNVHVSRLSPKSLHI